MKKPTGNWLLFIEILLGIGALLDGIFNISVIFNTIERSLYATGLILIITFLVTLVLALANRDFPKEFVKRLYLFALAAALLAWAPYAIKPLLSTDENQEQTSDENESTESPPTNPKNRSADTENKGKSKKTILDLSDSVHDLTCKLKSVAQLDNQLIINIEFSRPRDGKYSICGDDGTRKTICRDQNSFTYIASEIDIPQLNQRGKFCQWIDYKEYMDAVSAKITFEDVKPLDRISELRIAFSLGDAVFYDISLK